MVEKVVKGTDVSAPRAAPKRAAGADGSSDDRSKRVDLAQMRMWTTVPEEGRTPGSARRNIAWRRYDREHPGPPDGFLYIDTAVLRIQHQVNMPEGAAAVALLNALQSKEVRLFWNAGGGQGDELSEAELVATEFNLTTFRRYHRSGITVREEVYYLHQFIISKTDFDHWLGTLRGAGENELKAKVATTPNVNKQKNIEQREVKIQPTIHQNEIDETIDKAVQAEYDEAERLNKKPPNIRELADIVHPKLKAKGLVVSKNKISQRGEQPQFRKRRSKVGLRWRSSPF